MKLRHQDIRYKVIYQRGKINQSDYLSRHATSLSKLPQEQQEEAEELNRLFFTLHTTPVMDTIGISTIVDETKKDKTLIRLTKLLEKGKNCIPKNESKQVKQFKSIPNELTLSANGLILKGKELFYQRAFNKNPSNLHTEEHTQDKASLLED